MTTPARKPLTPQEAIAMANAGIADAIDLAAREVGPAARQFADAVEFAAEQVGRQFADAIDASGLFQEEQP